MANQALGELTGPPEVQFDFNGDITMGGEQGMGGMTGMPMGMTSTPMGMTGMQMGMTSMPMGMTSMPMGTTGGSIRLRNLATPPPPMTGPAPPTGPAPAPATGPAPTGPAPAPATGPTPTGPAPAPTTGTAPTGPAPAPPTGTTPTGPAPAPISGMTSLNVNVGANLGVDVNAALNAAAMIAGGLTGGLNITGGIQQQPPIGGMMPTGSGMLPTGTGMMPTGTGMMPTGSGMMPTGTGMMPTGAGMMAGPKITSEQFNSKLQFLADQAGQLFGGDGGSGGLKSELDKLSSAIEQCSCKAGIQSFLSTKIDSLTETMNSYPVPTFSVSEKMKTSVKAYLTANPNASIKSSLTDCVDPLKSITLTPGLDQVILGSFDNYDELNTFFTNVHTNCGANADFTMEFTNSSDKCSCSGTGCPTTIPSLKKASDWVGPKSYHVYGKCKAGKWNYAAFDENTTGVKECFYSDNDNDTNKEFFSSMDKCFGENLSDATRKECFGDAPSECTKAFDQQAENSGLDDMIKRSSIKYATFVECDKKKTDYKVENCMAVIDLYLIRSSITIRWAQFEMLGLVVELHNDYIATGGSITRRRLSTASTTFKVNDSALNAIADLPSTSTKVSTTSLKISGSTPTTAVNILNKF